MSVQLSKTEEVVLTAVIHMNDEGKLVDVNTLMEETKLSKHQIQSAVEHLNAVGFITV